MWLNGGYYYRGLIYYGEALGPLSQHLGGPPGPTENRGSELAWKEVIDFIENNRPSKRTNSYSGEDWPQIIGTWDSILYPHMASDADGHVTIPEADDTRREHDVCPCMLTPSNSQSPDCKLPNFKQRLLG